MTVTAEQHRIQSEQTAANLKRILNSPDGQELLKHLTEEFASQTSFVVGDPHYTSFKEGQRNVVLFLEDLKESTYEISEPTE